MLVSFDFDDTLLLTRPDDEWGAVEAGPNEPMLAALREHAAAGDTIVIVTSRIEAHELDGLSHQVGAGGEIAPHAEPPRTPVFVFVAAHKLPVTAVHFTNGRDKVSTLVALGVSKHFDDDDFELNLLDGTGIESVLAPSHPAWEAQ